MNIKLNQPKAKDIFVTAVILLAVIAVFQFVYFPKYRELERLKAGHKDAAREIEELYNFIGGRENLKDNIVDTRKKLALLEAAFPSEKEVSDVIRELNEQAKDFKINVISLKPEDLVFFKDKEGMEARVGDYCCKCMPLTLSVTSRYRDLGEFLIRLEADRTPMISIEEVDIERDEKIAPWVRADISIIAYILGN